MGGPGGPSAAVGRTSQSTGRVVRAPSTERPRTCLSNLCGDQRTGLLRAAPPSRSSPHATQQRCLRRPNTRVANAPRGGPRDARRRCTETTRDNTGRVEGSGDFVRANMTAGK
ncbi:hypothetical protein MTO96_009395 [Rhipicephalus appendiculatus]